MAVAQTDIVAQGVELMLYGMGTVVVFLALLVVLTGLMSTFVNRFFPETETVPSAPSPTGGQAAITTTDPQLLAVITAAIHRHRSDKS